MLSQENHSQVLLRRNRLLRDQRGLSTVEYVIILVLVAVFAIGAWKAFGSAIYGKVKDSNREVRDLDQTSSQSGQKSPGK